MPSRVLHRCISDSHFYSFGWLLFHIFAFELSYPALWVGLGWSNSMQYVGWLDYLLLYLFFNFRPICLCLSILYSSCMRHSFVYDLVSKKKKALSVSGCRSFLLPYVSVMLTFLLLSFRFSRSFSNLLFCVQKILK